jgi:Nif-specific regulatory protein
MDRLVNFPWPGNIRQLANKLENAMILSGDRKVLEVQDFQLEWPSVNGSQGLRLVAKEGEVISDRDPIMDLARRLQFNLREAKEAFELYFIDLALRETKGNKSQAARLIGITREGLRKALMKRDNEMASLGLAVLIGGAASALPPPSADEGDESGEDGGEHEKDNKDG